MVHCVYLSVNIFLLYCVPYHQVNEGEKEINLIPLSKQVTQLSQRDRAAGWVSFGQKWKAIFCRQDRSIINHCDGIGLQSYRIQ